MPREERKPRIAVDPGSIYQTRMTWTEESADKVGAWSWAVDRDWGQAWDDVIHPKLTQFQALTWAEIERFTTDSGHRSHHLMDAGVICNEAIERMYEIDRVADEIYRFRLGNKRRLWGYRVVSEFQILWYDPTHQIYPTDPD